MSVKKYRVLIRAFVRQRDVAAYFLIAKQLERMGCEVIMSSVRDFERNLKHWKPHLVLVNSPSRGMVVRKLAPHAKTVYLPGEGGEPFENSDALNFSLNPHYVEALDLFLPWGGIARKNFSRSFNKEKMKQVHVIGNPKLDFPLFLPKDLNNQKTSNSIGFVGRFMWINFYDQRPVISTLLLEKDDLDYTIGSAKNFFYGMKAISHIFKETNSSVSIRPYTIEAVEPYYEWVVPAIDVDNRLDIDDSLCFSYWAAQQKALLTPTSTSFIEASLLGVPTIILDHLTDSGEAAGRYIPMEAAGFSPRSLDELVEMLDGPLAAKPMSAEMEEHLLDYHGWDLQGSATKRAADHIMDLLENTKFPGMAYLPKPILKKWDDLSFARAMRKNRFHANNNFKEGYHEVPAFFDRVVDNIIANA